MKNSIMKIIIVLFITLLFVSSATSLTIQKEAIVDEDISTTGFDFFRDKNKIEIISPISTIPVFVELDTNFTIKFTCEDFENIYVKITTAYENIEDEFWLEVADLSDEDDFWYATVEVPNLIPIELYNLTIVALIDEEYYFDSEPRAVSIIDEFSDDFNFIHITDLHVGDIRGFEESIRETLFQRSIKRCIKEINLLQPDFVIISGDLVFGQYYPGEYRVEYKKCYDIIQMFDVPTFLAPGNHDGYRRLTEDGLRYWEEYFGPLYYSFDYGDFHFLSINSYDHSPLKRLTIGLVPLNWGGSISDEQLEWIEADLEETTDANLTFMFMHHNPLWDTKKDSLIGTSYQNRENLLGLIDDFNVSMVLAGHNHVDTVNTENDTIFLTTTTPESSIRNEEGYWGYRLIEINDSEISSYNYKEPRFSIPSYKLNVEYDGLYSATITNDLEMDVKILLKFSVPIRPYSVENGDIVMVRTSGIRNQYYIKANVSKESEKKVSLTYIS